MDGEIVSFRRWILPTQFSMPAHAIAELNVRPQVTLPNDNQVVQIRCQFQLRADGAAHLFRWIELRIFRLSGGPEVLVGALSFKLDDDSPDSLRPYVPLKMNITDKPGTGTHEYNFRFRRSNAHILQMYPEPRSLIDIVVRHIPQSKITGNSTNWTWVSS